MCFSETASLIAFFVGIAGQFALASKQDAQSKALALSLTSITIIQLYEYFLWRNPCTTNPNLNKNLSRLTMITIVLQPLYVLLSLMYVAKSISIHKNPVLLTAAVVYTILAIIEVTSKWKNVTCSEPAGVAVSGDACTSTSCGLNWEFVDEFSSFFWALYIGLLVSALYRGVAPVKTGLLVDAFILGSYGVTIALHQKQRSLASHWCFYSVALPWIFYFLPG
jgi:hypothetical protein